MTDRPGGLGNWGRERTRFGLGRQSVAGHDLTQYEQATFGQSRAIPTAPATEWEFPNSTRVKAYQYDFDTQQLRVRFIKYNTPWVYDDVPTTVFQAFDAAPSKGMYINSTLNYMSHRRASPQEEAQFFHNV
jgi:KTSC domain